MLKPKTFHTPAWFDDLAWELGRFSPNFRINFGWPK